MTLDAVLKQHLPSNLHPLLDRAPGPLDPVTSGAGPWDSSLTPLINSSGLPLVLLPGLHLLNSDVPSAHTIAQAHEDVQQTVFNYYHAILHRYEGEGEWWNAQYWFDRVSHPSLLRAYASPDELAAKPAGLSLREARTRAKRRVDACEAACRGRGGRNKELEAACWAEIKGLLGWLMEQGGGEKTAGRRG